MPGNQARATGTERTKVLSVRLTEQEFEALSARATEVGVGPSTLARTIVRQALSSLSTPTTPGTPPPAHEPARDSARDPARVAARGSAFESHLETLLAADLVARIEALEAWVETH